MAFAPLLLGVLELGRAPPSVAASASAFALRRGWPDRFPPRRASTPARPWHPGPPRACGAVGGARRQLTLGMDTPRRRMAMASKRWTPSVSFCWSALDPPSACGATSRRRRSSTPG
jgi:hypothetical protein